MELVIVGSVALDDLKTPNGEAINALGGSAVYSSISASYFTKPGIVGVVGDDFSSENLQILTDRGVILDGLEKAVGKTFHWSGYYEKDMGVAHTLDTQLNVFASFAPKIPEGFREAPFLFLANIDPVLQLDVLQNMRKPAFTLLDTMNYWIETKRQSLLDVIRKVDMVVVNDAEARQLSGTSNLLQAAKWIQKQGPRGVIIKKGEHGALLYWEDQLGIFPAFPLAHVMDPTGAGDTFAGGMMGALAQGKKINIEALKSAAVVGTIMASFTVEDFSVRRLANLTGNEMKSRHQTIRTLAEIRPMDLTIQP